MPAGHLWVVATPIGNLEDLSPRAQRVLGEVDLIAAEDTRHTRKLLAHFGIQAKLVSLHEHNEAGRVPALIHRLQDGDDIALVSDAGTPLISDPGYRLVGAARKAEIKISPVPGPCALVTALSVAGLASDRFFFDGFLPSKPSARQKRLEAIKERPETAIFYETPKRIADCLADMVSVFGPDRQAVLCRELTKLHETVWVDALQPLSQRIARRADQQRGEFVILVAGAGSFSDDNARLDEGKRLFALLRDEMPPGKAARIAAKFTGCRRNALYS